MWEQSLHLGVRLGDRGNLVGAWRSKIVFQSGPLAEMKGLEFLYAYNADGTMTEVVKRRRGGQFLPPSLRRVEADRPPNI